MHKHHILLTVAVLICSALGMLGLWGTDLAIGQNLRDKSQEPQNCSYINQYGDDIAVSEEELEEVLAENPEIEDFGCIGPGVDPVIIEDKPDANEKRDANQDNRGPQYKPGQTGRQPSVGVQPGANTPNSTADVSNMAPDKAAPVNPAPEEEKAEGPRSLGQDTPESADEESVALPDTGGPEILRSKP